MTLPDYQFTLNGLTTGDGTYYEIISVQHMMAPAISSDLPLIAGGVAAARDRKGGLGIIIAYDIHGTPGADMGGKLLAFSTAWDTGTNVDVPLTWHIEGIALDRHVNGRSRQCDIVIDDVAAMGVAKATVLFFAPDGHIYDSTNTRVPF